MFFLEFNRWDCTRLRATPVSLPLCVIKSSCPESVFFLPPLRCTDVRKRRQAGGSVDRSGLHALPLQLLSVNHARGGGVKEREREREGGGGRIRSVIELAHMIQPTDMCAVTSLTINHVQIHLYAVEMRRTTDCPPPSFC